MSNDGAPPAFTYFAYLPFELRAEIWKDIAFLARDIDLWAQNLGTVSDQRHEVTPFRYVTTQPPPSILHVNKESRAVGLKYYSLEFGSSVESPPKIYINFRCDRVCLLGEFERHSFPWIFDPRPTVQIDQRIVQFPIRIAMNIVTPYLIFPEDEDQLLTACNPYEEVLWYYLEDKNTLHLPSRGERASIGFLPVDASTKGNRGLCFELHTKLQAHHKRSEDSEILDDPLNESRLGGESRTAAKRLRPNVRWVTLVVNGRKFGLRD